MGNTKIILLILSEIQNILWKKLRKFILCYIEFVNCKKLT